MKWRATADRRVVEAVIAAFSGSAHQVREHLSPLAHRHWARSYHWLDASGMALYFLDQLQTLGIEDSLPAATLRRLQQNLADNRERSSVMFAEFAAINQAFQQAGIVYSNLKGFTLSPESCPDPELRCQLDLDFLVDGRQLGACQDILAKSGYVLTAATETVWEFKAGASELARIEDHYKAKPQRSVELHFAPPTSESGLPARDERLDRLRLRSLNGITFPALQDSDLFIGQALHLFGHVRSACTRVAWFLEYKRNVASHFADHGFWDEVRERSRTQRHGPVAIGLMTLLASQLFGIRSPATLDCWTLDRLPDPVRLWAYHYGPQALLADFPGTKLYLILEDELERGGKCRQKTKRDSLLPLHRAPRIVYAERDEALSKRFRRELWQARFNLFRLRYHLIEGLRYLVEARRWKKLRRDALQACKPLEAANESYPTES